MKPLARAGPASLVAAMLRVGAAGVLVRLLQAGKEVVVADRFGTRAELEAYLVAASVALFFSQSIGGALGDAVLPAYLQIRAREPLAAAALPQVVLRRALAPILLIALGVALGAPLLVPLLGAGLSPPARETAIAAMRALALVPALQIATALFSAAASAEGRAGLANTLLVATPLCTLACIIASGTTRALVLGLLLGSACEALLSFMLFRASRAGPAAASSLLPEELSAIGAQFLPLLGGALVGAISALVSQAMASSLGPGELSTLSYANRIVLPLAGLAAVVLNGALYPRISAEVALRDWPAVRGSMKSALALVAGGSAAVVAGLLLGAGPFVRLLFQRGAFTSADTARVAPVLVILAIQLLPLLVGIVGVRLLVALGDSASVLAIGALNAVLTVGGNLLLAPRLGIRGIAGVTVGVYVISAVLISARARLVLGRRERAG